eukprot:TRINITY_DN113608_c0_g1_i1.p1 TRINITY_DN113608_c0_g1~~TRINITY_DN113608_c0_g1_i1.p1  ORF type:complete len:547 (+),score=151.57 TRINITY_DN113608_c0_g1_i1:55-1695(+)
MAALSAKHSISARDSFVTSFGKKNIRTTWDEEAAARTRSFAAKLAEKIPVDILEQYKEQELPVVICRPMSTYSKAEVDNHQNFMSQLWIMEVGVEVYPDRVPGSYELGEGFAILDRSLNYALSKAGDKPINANRWAVSAGGAYKEHMGRLRYLRRKTRGALNKDIEVLKSKVQVSKTYSDARREIEQASTDPGDIDSNWILVAKQAEPQDPSEREKYWNTLTHIFMSPLCDEDSCMGAGSDVETLVASFGAVNFKDGSELADASVAPSSAAPLESQTTVELPEGEVDIEAALAAAGLKLVSKPGPITVDDDDALEQKSKRAERVRQRLPMPSLPDNLRLPADAEMSRSYMVDAAAQRALAPAAGEDDDDDGPANSDVGLSKAAPATKRGRPRKAGKTPTAKRPAAAPVAVKSKKAATAAPKAKAKAKIAKKGTTEAAAPHPTDREEPPVPKKVKKSEAVFDYRKLPTECHPSKEQTGQGNYTLYCNKTDARIGVRLKKSCFFLLTNSDGTAFNKKPQTIMFSSDPATTWKRCKTLTGFEERLLDVE